MHYIKGTLQRTKRPLNTFMIFKVQFHPIITIDFSFSYLHMVAFLLRGQGMLIDDISYMIIIYP